MLPLALIVLPIAPAMAQQTNDPSGGFQLDPVPTPSPAPGPVIAPLPTPSPTPRPLPERIEAPVILPTPAPTRVLPPPRPTERPTPRPTPAARATPATRPTPRPEPTPAATAARNEPVPAATGAALEPETVTPAEVTAVPIANPDVAASEPLLSETTAVAPPETDDGGILPWLIPFLLLLAGGAFWWWRNRVPAEAAARHDAANDGVSPAPALAPKASAPMLPDPPAPPRAAPQTLPADLSSNSVAKALPKGIVTSGAGTAPSQAAPSQTGPAQDAIPAGGTIRAFSGITDTPPDALPQASPSQALPPPAPRQPATPASATSGFVTTRIAPAPTSARPEMAMQLEIMGAEQTATHFVIQYKLWISNEGAGPCAGAVLRLDVLPGGQDTQKQVDAFFGQQARLGQTVAIPAMAPGSRAPIEGEMRVPLDPAIIFRMNDRQMIIPLVAADLGYRWDGGQDRREATFVIGRIGAAGQERLGPINVDRGPRLVRGIGAKPV